MNRPDEMAAKLETPAEKLGDQLRASFKDLQRPGDELRPVEDLHSLLLRISHHLDYETSERKTIYYRLQEITLLTRKAVEGQAKGRAWRASFVPYFVAICVGVAATLAWQSYGAIIATRAPDLGWSPESKQMIASWIQELDWTKRQTGQETTVQSSVPQTIAQAASEAVAPKTPAPASIDPQQVRQLEADIAAVQQTVEQQLAAVRQTVQQLSAGQDQMAHEISGLQTSDQEILEKIPAPPPSRPTAALAHKPTPPPWSRGPMPPYGSPYGPPY